MAISWIPLAGLLGMRAYVGGYEGWGRWAAAPLMLIPVGLSFALLAWGALTLARGEPSGEARWPLAGATLLAGVPALWFLLRLLVA